MILFPNIIINYDPPSNFFENDIELFHPSNFNNLISQVEVFNLKNVVITDAFVFSNFKGNFDYTHHHKPKFKNYYKHIIKRFLLPQIKFDNAILGMHVWSSNYFHWITETLPGLIAINKEYETTTVILTSNKTQYPYITDSLDMFNIPYYCKDQHHNVKVSNLYAIKVPEIAQYNPPFITKMKEGFIKKLGINSKIVPYRKIFISRKNATCRRIINEDELCHFLEKYNFETFYLEEFTIQEQVKLLHESKVVVSCHGAGLTNVLFMQPHQKVIELKAKNNDYWCFFTLARVANLDYNYLLCESEKTDHRVSDIQVDLNLLKKLL